MAAELKGAEEAVTRAVRQAGEGLKRDWRAQVTSARLGQRLANSIRSQHYPKSGTSISAAALVFSRAPKLIDAFDRGVTIRARNGLWLAIPTPAAGRARGGKKITPGEWEQRTGRRLRFVYRRGVPSLLVADQARITKRGLAVASRSKTGPRSGDRADLHPGPTGAPEEAARSRSGDAQLGEPPSGADHDALAGDESGASLMASRREEVLQRLFAVLGAIAGPRVLRGEILPERVPPEGLIILRDGDPGEPEMLLSPPEYVYEHRAEIEVVAHGPTPAARDAAFDALVGAIGAAIRAERTLGGSCDWAEVEAPEPVDLVVEGAPGFKAAVLTAVLHYGTPDPLN